MNFLNIFSDIYSWFFCDYYQVKNNILSVSLDDNDITKLFVNNFSLDKNKKLFKIIPDLNEIFELKILWINEFGNIQEITYNNKNNLVLFHHGIQWIKYDKKQKKYLLKKNNYLDLAF